MAKLFIQGQFFLVFICVFFSGSLISLPQEKWDLAYHSDRIYIYERMVVLSPTHSYRILKGEMTVNTSFDNAVSIICSPEKVSLWMSGIKENILLKRYSPSHWMAYTMFSLPWPFKDRDLISDYVVNTTNPGKYTEVTIKSIDEGIKEIKGVWRIRKYTASWKIIRLNEKEVYITYTASTDEPPVAPRAVQDPIVDRIFHQSLVNLVKLME